MGYTEEVANVSCGKSGRVECVNAALCRFREFGFEHGKFSTKAGGCVHAIRDRGVEAELVVINCKGEAARFRRVGVVGRSQRFSEAWRKLVEPFREGVDAVRSASDPVSGSVTGHTEVR